MKRQAMLLFVGLSSSICTMPLAFAADTTTAPADCSTCHGHDGISKDSSIPKLAGQYRDFLLKQIADYQDQRRSHHPTSLNELDLETATRLTNHYQQQPVVASNYPDISSPHPGEALYRNGDETRGVKQCANCHGIDGMGRGPAISMFPVIAGQHKTYLKTAMKAYRAGTRKNDVSGLMTYASTALSDADIELLADYLSSLGARQRAIKPVVSAKAAPIKQETKSAPPEPPSANSRKPTTKAKTPVQPETVIPEETNAKNIAVTQLLINEQNQKQRKLDNGKRKAISCEICHGKGGVSRNKYYPSLAKKDRTYLISQLKAYRSGDRQDAIMQEVAKSLSTTDMEEISAYFAAQ